VSRGLYEITLRTTAPAEAMTVLASAKAEVTSTGSGVPKASNLSSERVVVTLTSHAIPFSVGTHRPGAHRLSAGDPSRRARQAADPARPRADLCPFQDLEC